jgi:formylmethanofuran dehydrogenase subunit E
VEQENNKVNDTIQGHGETMGENGHLLSQLEQAGKVHGHICPSLFYGVCLAMRIKEWILAVNPASACEIILEGKSLCIRDGVCSVLGEGTPFTIQNTGQCALTAVCPDQHDQQQRHRLSISTSVRSRINELNQSLPLEEFKRAGVAYLQSLSPKELFGK